MKANMSNGTLNVDKPIVLIGMMGAGKSHIGRALSGALDFRFYDSDKVVEERAGCSIAEIFERDGEDKFRMVEHNVITDLLSGGVSVIATGGGAVLSADTRSALERGAYVVWLSASVDVLMERVQKSQTRPLLQTDDPKATLSALLEQRTDLYSNAADITVDIQSDHAGETVDFIIKALSETINPGSV